jgi:hypothetical protein
MNEKSANMTQNDRNLAGVAPCGIHCADCGPFLAKDDPAVLEECVARGIKRDRLPCLGCRAVKGNCPVLEETCETYACVSKRGFDFCFECPDFPCDKLNPAAHRAEILPHNLKVFNLCYIQRHGLGAWLKKAPEIKRRYYQGKMAIGKGPQIK